MHIPVLLEEVLKAFDERSLSTFFEGTVGMGGHAEALLRAHPEIERYIACDRDLMALGQSKLRLLPWEQKITWVHGPFSRIKEYLKGGAIDGFLIDIGVSSMQLDEGERGFSFLQDAPLDMRMDQTQEMTASTLVNTLPEVELARIFHEYGEEFRSRPAAKAIVLARKKRPIETTLQLVKILEPILRKGKVHFATKVFQALRIAVNDELGELKKGLSSAIDCLSSGGRLAVITFHSLEDRVVKWHLREEKRVNILTKKPIEASSEEVKRNRRARSAKLRIAEKI